METASSYERGPGFVPGQPPPGRLHARDYQPATKVVEFHEKGHKIISNGMQTTTSLPLNTSGLETE